MTEEAIKIGAYLRTLRLEENDSLEEIAAGITTAATLSRFERGETQLSAAVVLKLLTRFDQDVASIQQGYRALNQEKWNGQRWPASRHCRRWRRNSTSFGGKRDLSFIA